MLEYWYMLPASVLIATVALASGVEGATFFTPLFILVLGLAPEVAISTGLVTQLFGFASGLYSYAKKGLINYRLGMVLMVVTVPAALLGTYLSTIVAVSALGVVLAVGLVAVALSFLLDRSARVPRAGSDAEGLRDINITEGRIITAIGGLFTGMVSTGLGQMNGYFFLKRCRLPSGGAVATSVLIVAVTTLVASAGHTLKLLKMGDESMMEVMTLIIFTAPGVLIGGQIGPALSSRIPQKALETGLAVMFLIVAALLLLEPLKSIL